MSSSLVIEAAQQRGSPEMPGMSFLEHLEELRRRIVYTALYIIGGFGVCWWFHDRIFAVMQKPIVTALAAHRMDTQLVYLNPTDPFNTYLKISSLAGVFVAAPLVLYQVWAFIAPGLYRNERRYILPFMSSTVGLFLLGGLFGYEMVYPAALDFLIGWSSQFKPMITVQEYIDLFLTIIGGLGVIFEMPILVFFLALMGVISAGWMWLNFRYAILVIFIIAAIITPTTDIMNMCIFAAPMIVLYLISIAIAWFVHPKQRRARVRSRTQNARNSAIG